MFVDEKVKTMRFIGLVYYYLVIRNKSSHRGKVYGAGSYCSKVSSFFHFVRHRKRQTACLLSHVVAKKHVYLGME